MKHNRHFLTALLLIAVLGTVSCAGADNTPAETTAPIPGSTEAETAGETTALYSADYLPEADYNGYVFRTVTVEDFPVAMEQEDGDVVNDAIYRRNLVISERFNVTFADAYVDDYNAIRNLGVPQAKHLRHPRFSFSRFCSSVGVFLSCAAGKHKHISVAHHICDFAQPAAEHKAVIRRQNSANTVIRRRQRK